MIGFRLVFSGGVQFGTRLFLRIQGLVQHLCVQYSSTAPVCAVHWYSNYVCITGVKHLGVQYGGTAPVCAVQWYGTCVCSTVVQHLCVQYSKGVLA